MTVRTKILIVFLSLSMVALGVIGYAAFSTMNNMGASALESSGQLGDQAVSESTTALEANAETSLLQLATDQADISNVVFSQVDGEMDTLAMYATSVRARPPAPHPLYSQSESPQDPNTSSVYILAPGVTRAGVQNELFSLASMDDVMGPLLSSDPRITQLYIGTGSGILYVHPWVSGISRSYDPRTRDWYIHAEQTGTLSWSDPYVDASGKGLMITCSRPVAGSGGNSTWVVASDVTLSTINTQIINTQIGDQGYAMLIDSHGNVIARPGLTEGEKGWDEAFETENLLSSNNSALASVARNMVAGESGTARVPFDDGEKYVAYAPVKSINWSIAIVEPVDEVIAPAQNTRAQIVNATGETGAHLNQAINTAKALFIALFILLFIMVTVLSVLFAQVITRPVAALKSGSEAIGAGDLGYRVDISTGDEFEDLAHSFNTMAADLKDYIDELQRTTAEKERFAKELEIAKGIQQSFLPDKTPEIAGVEIAARNIPALEVGGDFYDFIPLGKDRWGLVIADVSGKGVPAALFMALSRTLIRASTLANADPAGAIGHANRLICEDSKTNMFVTLFYAILDSQAMTLNYVNAGHNPPLLLKGTTSDVVLLKAKGIALGVTEEAALQSVRMDLRPGDVLVLYTDGVTEAINEREEEFGEQRLLSVIIENRTLAAAEILEKILTAITVFAGDRPQHDDITLMVLRAL
jgi:sigma-B regulation protein RsbU (phosphoserine phosphatase)